MKTITKDKVSERIGLYHVGKQFKKYGFHCFCSKKWVDKSGFTRLGLVFHTQEELTIAKARKCLIESVMSYRDDINEHEQFKEHFVEWPFPIGRLEYCIEVVDGSGGWIQFPNGLTPDNKISYIELDPIVKKINYFISVDPKMLPEKVNHSKKPWQS